MSIDPIEEPCGLKDGVVIIPRAQFYTLIAAAEECALELECMIEHQYRGTLGYPVQKRRYDRDMETVTDVRSALATVRPIGSGDDTL